MREHTKRRAFELADKMAVLIYRATAGMHLKLRYISSRKGPSQELYSVLDLLN